MHGDDIDVAYDGVGQREGDDDLEFERRHVTVHCYFLERVEESEVAALGGRFGRCRDCEGDIFKSSRRTVTVSKVGWWVLLTALVDDVEGGVCDVVGFEEVFGRAGESADEDRVVLW